MVANTKVKRIKKKKIDKVEELDFDAKSIHKKMHCTNPSMGANRTVRHTYDKGIMNATAVKITERV